MRCKCYKTNPLIRESKLGRALRDKQIATAFMLSWIAMAFLLGSFVLGGL